MGKMLLSDNWWLDGDKAFFCAAKVNMLFCTDMASGQCRIVADMPVSEFMSHRLYPYCIKDENVVYCLPCNGEDIWYYELKSGLWAKIELQHAEPLYFIKSSFQKENHTICLIEKAVGKIYVINLKNKMVEKEISFLASGCPNVGECVYVHENVYCVSKKRIYRIDIKNGRQSIYDIPELTEDLYIICFDGTDFWLNGYSKEICIWNPEFGVRKIIRDFPKGIRIYDNNEESLWGRYSVFNDAISLGNYVWMIPFHWKSSIIYIEKETYEIREFEIKEERDTGEESGKRRIPMKYVTGYIRDNRYIGLFSFKSEKIFEIDTEEMLVKQTEYELTRDTIQTLAAKYYDINGFLSEKKENDRKLFRMFLENNMRNEGEPVRKEGASIYSQIKQI